MSVILDALKKLDREKSSRRDGAANIAAEILRPDQPRPGRRIFFYLVAVSLATAAITYVSMVKFGLLSKSPPPEAVSSIAPSQPVVSSVSEAAFPPKSSPPAPVTPAPQRQRVSPTAPEPGSVSKSPSPLPVNPPASSQQEPPATLSREPVREAREKASQAPAKVETEAETKGPPSSIDEKKAIEADVVPRTPRKSVEPRPAESRITPESLRISGIVWHPDPSERRAVINGMILREGAEIEGIKVVEISPTRVRFLHNGQFFEHSVFR